MRKLTSLLMLVALVACSTFSLKQAEEYLPKDNVISLASEERDSESDGVVLFSLEEESQEY